MSNQLIIGLAEKNFEYPKGSLVITDEPVLKRGEKLYDPAKHGLNPLPMQYREARELAAALFPDKDLMTFRNGRRALTRLVMNAGRLATFLRNDTMLKNGFSRSRLSVGPLVNLSSSYTSTVRSVLYCEES
jgi:hypothetical protein